MIIWNDNDILFDGIIVTVFCFLNSFVFNVLIADVDFVSITPKRVQPTDFWRFNYMAHIIWNIHIVLISYAPYGMVQLLDIIGLDQGLMRSTLALEFIVELLIESNFVSLSGSNSLYRTGPLMIAIIFMMGTKYDCNDDDNWDLI